MASIKELLFTVRAKAEGVKGTTKQTDKMADSIERSDKARKGAGKGQNSYNKREKALHQSNLSSAKGFSKMNQTIGGGSSGLVGAYATLAANVFAATAAFNALRRAAQLDVLVEGLEYVGNAAGRNLGFIADNLKEITGHAISTEDAMRGVALGVSAGFSSEQMEKLTKVARGAALALGRDMGDAMSRLTRGAAKLEPEILDELGIMVRLDEATQTYAAQIGKSVEALTSYERRMAFINAINTEGLEKFGAIADAIEPSAYDQLSAAMADLAQAGLALINNFLTPVIKLMSGSTQVLIGAFTLFGSTISRSMLPALYGVANRASTAAQAESELAAATAKTANESNVAARASIKNIKVHDEATKGMQEQIEAQRGASNQADEAVKTNKKLDNSNKVYIRNQQKMKEALEQKGATEKNINKKTLADGKRAEAGLERNAVIRAQVKASVDAETAAKHSNTAATRANAVAQNKANTASAYGMARLSTLIPGWRLLTSVMRENTVSILANTTAGFNLTRMWAVMKVGLMRTAMAVRFLGTALLTALPYLGMLVIAVGLLKQAWEHFFPEDAFDAATDKALEGLESILEANEALRKSLEATNDTVRKTELQYTTFAGILQNIADMSAGVQEAASEKAVAAIIKAREEIGKLESEMDRMKAYIEGSQDDVTKSGALQLRPHMQMANIPMAEKRLKAWKDMVDKTKGALEGLLVAEKTINTEQEKTNIKSFLDKSIDMLKASTSLDDKQKGMIKTLTALRAKVDSGTLSWVEYHTAVANLGKEQKGYLDGLTGAKQATALLATETNKLAQLVTTPYDKAIKAMDGMLDSFAHVQGAAEEAFEWMAEGPERQKKIADLVIELNAALEDKLKISSVQGKLDKKTLVNKLTELKDNQKILRTYKAQIKELKTQRGLYSDAAKQIPIALETQLHLTNKITDKEIEGVQATIDNTKALLSIEHAYAANVKHEAELVALTQQQISDNQIILEGKVKQAELNKKMFKWEEKAYQLRKSTQDLAQEEFELQIRLENLTSGRARLGKKVSAGQEMAIAEAKNNLELSRINKEMEMSKRKAEVEYELIRLQFTLLQMQIEERLAKRRDVLQEQVDLFAAVKNSEAEKTKAAADRFAEAEKVSGDLKKWSLTSGASDEQKAAFKEERKQAKLELIEAEAHVKAVKKSIDLATARLPILRDELTDIPGILAESAKSFSKIYPLLEEQYNATVDNIEKKAIVARLRLTVDNLQLAQDLRKAITASISGSANDLGSSMSEIADRMYGALEARRKAAKQLAESDLKATGVSLGKAGFTRAATGDEITAAGKKAAEGVQDLDLGVLEYMQVATSLSAGMIENMKALGPGGETMAAVMEGALMIGTVWTVAFERIGSAGEGMKARLGTAFDKTKSNFSQMNLEEKSEVAAAALGAMASTIGAIANIKAKQSSEAIAGIDREIAAEKKKDGKSKESLAKIAQLEAKKEAMKKKAWETNKKMMIGQAIMSTAAGIASALPNVVLAAIVGVMGAIQIATIASTSYQGGGSSPSIPSPPTQASIGKRANKVDVAGGRQNVMGELAYLRGESGVGTSARDFRPGGFAGRKYRAAGGFVVGEQGPELLIPQMPGQVLSQSDAAGMGAPVNVTFQINAMDTANMEEMLENRRGSIINMIRGAANEHGQDFLEMIDTDTYNEEQKAAGGPMRSYE